MTVARAAAVAAALVVAAVATTARADPEPDTDHEAQPPPMPPFIARFGLCVTWLGGRAGLTVAARVSDRFAVGGQFGAFEYQPAALATTSSDAWFVGPVGALAPGSGILFTLGGGYAQARHREKADTTAYRGVGVSAGLHWLGVGGIGLAARYDAVVDPLGHVPAIGAFTLNVELGPPA